MTIFPVFGDRNVWEKSHVSGNQIHSEMMLLTDERDFVVILNTTA